MSHASEPMQLTPQCLLDMLRDTGRASVNQWTFIADEHGTWGVNPYGVDATLLPTTLAGCAMLLEWANSDADF